MERNNIKIPKLFIPALLISVQPITGTTTEQRKDSLKNVLLDEVVVKTSGGEKYNTTTLSNDFRLTGEVIEVPQVIQILDANILKDQFVLNVNESVTRNVSGAFREELHNGISPDIYCRGGYINPQRNGVDLRPILKGPLADDISVIECVEFVKGPSVYMNSLGDAAGSYNIITKKPTGYKKNTVKLIQGSFNLLRDEADLDGILDRKGKLLYRPNILASQNH